MKKIRCNALVYCILLITLCFFLTASGYLSWLYHLTVFVDASKADWMSEVVGYLFQAAGFLLFGLAVKKNHTIVENKKAFLVVLCLDVIFILAATLSLNLALALLCGYLMNIFHGIVAGFYCSYLAVFVKWNHCALAFGLSYGLASIGTWLFSLPVGGTFLHTPYALASYLLFAVVIGCMLFFDVEKEAKTDNSCNVSYPFQLILFAGLTVLLFSLVKNIGFYFPMADISSGIKLEWSRLFYAVGLIAAGWINDHNRLHGAIACLVALVSPFVLLFLQKELTVSILIWILGYLLFGFFTVYRVVLFVDIAKQNQSYLFLAGFGMLFGRIGDALGALGGMLFKEYTLFAVLITVVLYSISIVLFFRIFHTLYYPPETVLATEEPSHIADFSKEYDFSPREIEVFSKLLDGHSNAEISALLFISENTVKFHVRNVLKKTGTKRRTELIALYESKQ